MVCKRDNSAFLLEPFPTTPLHPAALLMNKANPKVVVMSGNAHLPHSQANSLMPMALSLFSCLEVLEYWDATWNQRHHLQSTWAPKVGEAKGLWLQEGWSGTYRLRPDDKNEQPRWALEQRELWEVPTMWTASQHLE